MQVLKLSNCKTTKSGHSFNHTSNMKRIDNIYEVTRRLCGMIDPQGESNIDAVRFENLEQTIDVAEKLIADIIHVSKNKDRYEASMKHAGLRADKFVKELQETLNDLQQ